MSGTTRADDLGRGADTVSTVRVMSFNLLYAAEASEPPAPQCRWAQRKALLAEIVRGFDPDLLGTQECLPKQADFLTEQLPGYQLVGLASDEVNRKGEYAPLLYKSNRFEKLDSGVFWLCEDPGAVGSKGWDAEAERVCTWAKLRDRSNGRILLFLNTHWDHFGKTARLESARLMHRWIGEYCDGGAVVVTGDFNDVPGSEPYKLFVSGQSSGQPSFAPLTDTFRAIHPPSTEEATYHAFKGTRAGNRFDWICCNDSFSVLDAAIDRTTRDGLFPSDHYPVTSILAWR